VNCKESTMGWESLKELAVSETGFVFDPGTGMTFQVNATGKHILRKLQEGSPVNEIEAEIQEAFRVQGDDLTRDILEFVSLLKKHELLRTGEDDSW
jgi:hypothetical protein